MNEGQTLVLIGALLMLLALTFGALLAYREQTPRFSFRCKLGFHDDYLCVRRRLLPHYYRCGRCGRTRQFEQGSR